MSSISTSAIDQHQTTDVSNHQNSVSALKINAVGETFAFLGSVKNGGHAVGSVARTSQRQKRTPKLFSTAVFSVFTTARRRGGATPRVVMAPGGGNAAADDSIFDEDNEQSKPLLGEDYERDGEDSGTVLPAKKLAEYLPLPVESLSMVHRLLRGLYGHLPREDVPRIIWVSLVGCFYFIFCRSGTKQWRTAVSPTTNVLS